MSRCLVCHVDVVGTWRRCPLCRQALEVTPAASTDPYPRAPLRFDRRQLRRALIVLSVIAVAASFGAQLLVPQLLAPIRTIWLALATLWLVVLATAYRRRNVGSLVAWLVLALSLVAVAWDSVTGVNGWATTWAIPAICTFANIALAVAVRIVRLAPSEYLAKAVLVLVFGLVPGVFVILGWVTVVLPALVCVGFSVLLLATMVIFRRAALATALYRRLQL